VGKQSAERSSRAAGSNTATRLLVGSDGQARYSGNEGVGSCSYAEPEVVPRYAHRPLDAWAVLF